jgi:hypothetical protein
VYFNITNFCKHQNPHKNERDKGSEIPVFSEKGRQAIDFKGLTINRDLSGLNQDENGTDPADSLIPYPDSLSLIPESIPLVPSSDADISESKKVVIKKPESFKRFFALYPPTKKGGSDASAWKKAKAMKLTESDFEMMANDIGFRKQANPEWFDRYALGICKHMEEKIWLTPLPERTRESQTPLEKTMITLMNTKLPNLDQGL